MPKSGAPTEYTHGIAARMKLKSRSNSTQKRVEYISSANSAGGTTATDTSTHQASALQSTSFEYFLIFCEE